MVPVEPLGLKGKGNFSFPPLLTQDCMDYNDNEHPALEEVKNISWCWQGGGKKLLKINK